VRTHGWDGNVPADDAEATRRILDVTRAVVKEKGADTRLADVARLLGVTRQTVYRYFPGTQALLMAVANETAEIFLRQITSHLRDIEDPGDVIVEGIAYTIEQIPEQPYLALLLQPQHVRIFGEVLTSDIAQYLGRNLLARIDVDWAGAGISDADMVELTEAMLRTVQSFLLDPGRPPRRGADLRRYLRRWALPAMLA
jgi:AcrR family transcriptional regulator